MERSQDIIQDIKDGEGCTGYKYPETCPHDGVFKPGSDSCSECVKDAEDGMRRC